MKAFSRFIVKNARWIAGGFFLTFFSHSGRPSLSRFPAAAFGTSTGLAMVTSASSICSQRSPARQHCAGQLIDRFSAVSLLPLFPLPLALACLAAALLTAPWAIFIFTAFLGVCYGLSSTLEGAPWPEIYGTKHLGAVRSVVVAAVVFASAVGPGITGYLIDAGVSYPLQLATMGSYSLGTAALMWFVSRRLNDRSSNQTTLLS